MKFRNKADLAEWLAYERAIYYPDRGVSLPFSFREKDILWKFVRTLRYVEYYEDTGKRCLAALSRFKLRRMTYRYALHIPPHVCGKGLSIAHVGPIIINSKASIGEDCRIHVGVNIGANGGDSPRIGDRVYIGPGAKVFGDISLADDIKIGANAVVNKSCHESGTVLVGVPAKPVMK